MYFKVDTEEEIKSHQRTYHSRYVFYVCLSNVIFAYCLISCKVIVKIKIEMLVIKDSSLMQVTRSFNTHHKLKILPSLSAHGLSLG